MFDLEKTFQFWGRDLLMAAGKTLKLKPGVPGSKLQIRIDGGNAFITAPGDYLLVRRCRGTELVRKVGVKTGLCHDYRSIEQRHALERIREFRVQLSKALGIRSQSGKLSFLLRVDDFPSPLVSSEDFMKFHTAARRASVPYLLAVTPFLVRPNGPARLTEREIDILKKCTAEGAVLAMHGFSHESRYTNVKSELRGMSEKELRINLEKAFSVFEQLSGRPRVFVAPFNHYGSTTLPELTRSFNVLCGGPESTSLMGYAVGPAWMGDCVYLPSYRGAYDRISKRILNGTGLPEGLPVPLTLHWANGARDQWKEMSRLLERLKGRVLDWKGQLESGEMGTKS